MRDLGLNRGVVFFIFTLSNKLSVLFTKRHTLLYKVCLFSIVFRRWGIVWAQIKIRLNSSITNNYNDHSTDIVLKKETEIQS